MIRLWTVYAFSVLALTQLVISTKYFSEPGETDTLHHYDSRFFKGVVTDDERQLSLQALIRAYLLLFDKLNLQTWIAHGTLLGWYWNSAILPWDWDLDTQVTNATLHRLGADFNNTYHDFESPELNLSRRYLLDINPFSRERVRGDGDNIIDGRFIDTSNGLFLDITGLSANDEENEDIIECKNEHKYNITDIFPLRETTFEGAKAQVPFAYTKVLADEYTYRALYQTKFYDHTFDTREGKWRKIQKLSDDDGPAPDGGAYA